MRAVHAKYLISYSHLLWISFHFISIYYWNKLKKQFPNISYSYSFRRFLNVDYHHVLSFKWGITFNWDIVWLAESRKSDYFESLDAYFKNARWELHLWKCAGQILLIGLSRDSLYPEFWRIARLPFNFSH